MTLDGETHSIQAGVDNLGGYSAHADQQGLIRFVTGMRKAPGAIRIVHGDEGTKRTLQQVLRSKLAQREPEIFIP